MQSEVQCCGTVKAIWNSRCFTNGSIYKVWLHPVIFTTNELAQYSSHYDLKSPSSLWGYVWVTIYSKFRNIADGLQTPIKTLTTTTYIVDISHTGLNKLRIYCSLHRKKMHSLLNKPYSKSDT